MGSRRDEYVGSVYDRETSCFGMGRGGGVDLRRVISLLVGRRNSYGCRRLKGKWVVVVRRAFISNVAL